MSDCKCPLSESFYIGVDLSDNEAHMIEVGWRILPDGTYEIHGTYEVLDILETELKDKTDE